MVIYDTIIIGGGPAGLTAALYAGRYNMKTLVIASSFGGTANLAGEIENWPGFTGSGVELMNKFREQAESFGAEFLEANVEMAEKVNGEFVIYYGDKTINGKTLILAMGTEHRQLNIPGEKEFLGKGVSYCATCDGNFFREKTVAVIGGANSAAKAALYLADICKKVYVIYRKHEMRCEPVSLSKICSTPNIEILYYSSPTEILGENVVKKIKVKSEDKGDIELNIDGVFIEVGATPAIDVIKDLKLDVDGNYIITNKDAQTNQEGVFAAGDVTNNSMKQIVTAAGEGAIAAKMAHEFLMKL